MFFALQIEVLQYFIPNRYFSLLDIVADGVLTFKIESIIQLNSHCTVEFISSQSITKYIKNNDIEFPDKLNKYQEQAYLVTITR